MNPHLEWIRNFLLRKSSFNSNYKKNSYTNKPKSELFNQLMSIRYRLLKPGTSEFVDHTIYSITISYIDPNFPFEKSNFLLIRSYLQNYLPDSSISINELESKIFTKSHEALCKLILQYYLRYNIKPSTISPTSYGLESDSYEDAFTQWGRSICNTEIPYLPANFMIDFGTAQVVAIILSKIQPSLISLNHIKFARNLSENEISKNWREVGTALTVMDIHVPSKFEWGDKLCLLCFAADLFKAVYQATHSSNIVQYQMQTNQQINQGENNKDLNRIDFLIGQLNSISNGNPKVLLSSPIEHNPILLHKQMIKEQQEQEQQLIQMQLRIQQEQQQLNEILQSQVINKQKMIEDNTNNQNNLDKMIEYANSKQNERIKITSKPKPISNNEMESKPIEDDLIRKRSKEFKKLQKAEKMRKQQLTEKKENIDTAKNANPTPQYKTLSSFAIDPSFPNQSKKTTSKELIRNKNDDEIKQFPVNQQKKYNQNSSTKVSYITFNDNQNTDLMQKHRSKHIHKHSNIAENEPLFDTVISANRQMDNTIASNSKDFKNIVIEQKEGFKKEIKNHKHAVNLLESIYQYIEQQRKELANASLVKEIEESASVKTETVQKRNEISNPIAIFDVKSIDQNSKNKTIKQENDDDTYPKVDKKHQKSHSSKKKNESISTEKAKPQREHNNKNAKETESKLTNSQPPESHKEVSTSGKKEKKQTSKQDSIQNLKDPFDTSIDFSKNTDLFDSDSINYSNADKSNQNLHNSGNKHNNENISNVIDDPLLLLELEKGQKEQISTPIKANSNEPSTNAIKQANSNISTNDALNKSQPIDKYQSSQIPENIHIENDANNKHDNFSNAASGNTSTLSDSKNLDQRNNSSHNTVNNIESFKGNETNNMDKLKSIEKANNKIETNSISKSDKPALSNTPKENDSMDLTFSLFDKTENTTQFTNTTNSAIESILNKKSTIKDEYDALPSKINSTSTANKQNEVLDDSMNPNHAKAELKEPLKSNAYQDFTYGVNNNEDSNLQELKDKLLNDFSQTQTGLDFSMQTDLTFPDIPSLTESTLQISDKVQTGMPNKTNSGITPNSQQPKDEPKPEHEIGQKKYESLQDETKPSIDTEKNDERKPKYDSKTKIASEKDKKQSKSKDNVKPKTENKPSKTKTSKPTLKSQDSIKSKEDISPKESSRSKVKKKQETDLETKANVPLKTKKPSKDSIQPKNEKSQSNMKNQDKSTLNDKTKDKSNLDSNNSDAINSKNNTQKALNNIQQNQDHINSKKNTMPIPPTKPNTPLQQQISKLSNQKSESLTPADLSIGSISSISSNITISEENAKQETKDDGSHLNQNNDLSIELNSSEIEVSSSKQKSKSSSDSLIFEQNKPNKEDTNSKQTNLSIDGSHSSGKSESAVDEFIPEIEKHSQDEKKNQSSSTNIQTTQPPQNDTNNEIKKFHSSSSSSDSIPFKIIPNDSKEQNEIPNQNENDNNHESDQNIILQTQNQVDTNNQTTDAKDPKDSITQDKIETIDQSQSTTAIENEKRSIENSKEKDSNPLTSLIEEFDLSSLKSERRKNRSKITSQPIQATSGPIKLDTDPVPKKTSGKGPSSETRRVSFDLKNLAPFQASLSAKHQMNLKTLANLNNSKNETDSLSFPLSPQHTETSDNNDVDTFMSTTSFNQSGTISIEDRLNMFTKDPNELSLSLSLTDGEPEIVKQYRDASSANADRSYIWLADDEQAILEGMLPTIVAGVEFKDIQAFVANELKLKMNNSTVKRITANLKAFLRHNKKQ